MKSVIVLTALFIANIASANVGAINYLYCIYGEEGQEKMPLVTVAEPPFKCVQAESDECTEYYAEELAVSLAYKKADGKKVITNATIDKADYNSFPNVKFSGKTADGKKIQLKINYDTSESTMNVNGVEQTYPTALSCGFGLAG